MKTYLAIDTATDTLFVSLTVAGTNVFLYAEKGKRDHAVKLMPTIIKALSDHSLDQKHLEGIIVGVGPGSYTGVRMGVVVAKMLASEWHVPLFEVSTLALMASGLNEDVGGAMIDARNDYVFGAVYNFATAETLVAPSYLEKTDLLERFPQATFKETLLPNMDRLLGSPWVNAVSDIDALTPNYVRRTKAEKDRHDS